MTHKSTFVVPVLGVIAAMLLVAFAIVQAAQAQAGQIDRQERPLGSWSVEAETPGQGKFPALLTFSADGSVIADEPPSPFETSAHGNWSSAEAGRVAYTFVALVGSTQGPLSARIKVVGRLQFDAGTGGWGGPFKVTVIDKDGKVTFTDRGTFRLTPIAVEPLD